MTMEYLGSPSYVFNRTDEHQFGLMPLIGTAQQDLVSAISDPCKLINHFIINQLHPC